MAIDVQLTASCFRLFYCKICEVKYIKSHKLIFIFLVLDSLILINTRLIQVNGSQLYVFILLTDSQLIVFQLIRVKKIIQNYSYSFNIYSWGG